MKAILAGALLATVLAGCVTNEMPSPSAAIPTPTKFEDDDIGPNTLKRAIAEAHCPKIAPGMQSGLLDASEQLSGSSM